MIENVQVRSSCRRYYIVFWCAVALSGCVYIGISYSAGDGLGVFLGMIILFLSLLWLFRLAREGIDLTPSGLIIRRFGSKRIPWPDIVDVEVRKFGPVRQTRIVGRGRRTRALPVPGDQWPLREVDFDEKFETLRRYWVEYR